MNARRVHQLMLRHFPKFESAAHDWQLLMRDAHCQPQQVQAFLEGVFDNELILVDVHRTVGGIFPRNAAAEFIAPHVGKTNIRIANRSFTTLAFVASPGVATSWHQSAATSDGSFAPSANGLSIGNE